MIVVDTREQKPLFEGGYRMALKSGDYSVQGFEDRISVERKSISDAFGSMGGSRGERRKRFLREIRRLSLIKHPAILIEATPADIMSYCPPGDIHAGHVIGALMSWSVAYRIPVYFADDRPQARLLCWLFMKNAYEIEMEGSKHRHAPVPCQCGGNGPVEHSKGCKNVGEQDRESASSTEAGRM